MVRQWEKAADFPVCGSDARRQYVTKSEMETQHG